MTETCKACGLVHIEGDFAECVRAQRNAMEKLLNLAGTPSVCRACGASILFVQHNNGANTPYTKAGLNHFVDCPRAEQFRKGARA